MTIDEFLKKLSEHKGGWTIGHEGEIRRDCLCPIEVLGHAQWAGTATSCAEGLGLTHHDAWEIAWAADRNGSRNPALRARILAAIGLEEAKL